MFMLNISGGAPGCFRVGSATGAATLGAHGPPAAGSRAGRAPCSSGDTTGAAAKGVGLGGQGHEQR